MNNLIELNHQHHTSNNANLPTVNARELHGFLGNKMHFADWIKKRIAEYGFIEQEDYTRIELKAGFQAATTGGGLAEILASQKNEALKTTTYDFGQQGRVEYFVSLDMAKELAMVERNDKGKQARKYFIECEKQLSGSLKQINFSDLLAAAQAFIAAETERRQLAAQVAEIAPKAAALDLLSDRKGLFNFRVTAKHLKIKEKELKALLYQLKWAIKGSSPLQVTQYAETQGYAVQVTGDTRNEYHYTQMLFTSKGTAKLAEELMKRKGATNE